MLELVRPNLDYKDGYIEMIKEWKEYGRPFEPCLIEYDCNNPIEKLDYCSMINVANDYSKGKIFEYDINYFDASDFYFIVDENELIGMCEFRHHLSNIGQDIKGNVNCGIRPSKRNCGYCQGAIKELLKEREEDNFYMCFDESNEIMQKVATFLGFKQRKSTTVDGKVIVSYIKDVL